MENEQKKYWFFGSKLNTALLLILIILMVIALKWMYQNQEFYRQNLGVKDEYQIPVGDTKYDGNPSEIVNTTYIYNKHGFTIEIPKSIIPYEVVNARGTRTDIFIGDSLIAYVTDASVWENNAQNSFTYKRDEKIGQTIFKVYQNGENEIYWFKQGQVGYYSGDKGLLQTFKFIGWPVSTVLPKYMGTMASGAGWPPIITTSSAIYSCTRSTPREGPTTLEKVIGGKKYCVSSFIDGAAGSRGGEYSYIRSEGSGTKTAKFSLYWVNCGGYGGPGDTEYGECNTNQTTFFNNLDQLINSLM